MVGPAAVHRTNVEVVGVENTGKIYPVAGTPVGRVGIRGRQCLLGIAPILEVRARRAHDGVLLSDEPAIDVGGDHAGLSVIVDVLGTSWVPSKEDAVRSHRPLEGVRNSNIHFPSDPVSREPLRQRPLPLEVVHVDHLVAAGRIGIVVVLDEIGTANLLHTADGRWKDVVVLRAVVVGKAQRWLLPMQSVVGNGVASLVSPFRLPAAARARTFQRAGRAVPHLEVAVLLVVHNRSAVEIDPTSAALPGPVGLDDRIIFVSHGPVELAHDVVERIDDVIIEKELLGGADVDWGCHWSLCIEVHNRNELSTA